MGSWYGRVVLTALAALVGYAVGWAGGTVRHARPRLDDYSYLAERTPLPHHVPEFPSGVTLRFAMVQDVIHERYARHGLAYYRERDRLDRERLAALAPADPARFSLADDLGVGLERLGQSAEAVKVLRAKLDAQLSQGKTGLDLYTSYANLGTFLIHASVKAAMAGDRAARDEFREGVEFIRKSVEVNPGAHFGRERWQAAIAEYLLAAMDDPGWLKTYDCLGHRLDLGIEEILHREANWSRVDYGRPTDAAFGQGKAVQEVPAFFRAGIRPDDPALWSELSPIRAFVSKVGAEEGWEQVPVPSHRSPVPFDGPVLGIIGMWRQGGGANPYFALALGETMLRVGQRPIAWAAYERAQRLASRFWPDPALQQFLREHCQARQAQIEATLSYKPPAAPTGSSTLTPWQQVSPTRATDTATRLRARFDAELKFGEDFQRRYQEYEAAKIAAGGSILDDHFFDAFDPGPVPIASPVGPEEWFVGVPRARLEAESKRWAYAWGILGAGLAAMGTALMQQCRSASRTSRPKEPTQEDETGQEPLSGG